jgi:hypothetical protein
MQKTLWFALAFESFVAPLGVQLGAQSVLTTRLDDPRAVYVGGPVEGETNDTTALQTAIDKAAGTGREGVVFVPPGQNGLTVERDNPLDSVNLAFDRAGDLLVVSSEGLIGTVYAFRPGTSEENITVLHPQPTKQRPGERAILPANYWNNGEFRDQLNPQNYTYTTLPEMFARDVKTPRLKEYVSPDGSIFLPAARMPDQGPTDYTGWRFSDNLDTYGFLNAAIGSRV